MRTQTFRNKTAGAFPAVFSLGFMRLPSGTAAICAALLSSDPVSEAHAELATGRATVVGTELSVSLLDGQVLRGADLIGQILFQPGQGTFRINEAIRTPDELGASWLFDLAVLDRANDQWKPFCAPDANGQQLGFAISGRFDATGSYTSTPDAFAFTCTGGAAAKCLRLGYVPWKEDENGTSLLNHFRACLRMIRADYCGNGRSYTAKGIPVDVYDSLGLNEPEPLTRMQFEAAWGPDGAICVAKTRLEGILSLVELEEICGGKVTSPFGPTCNPVFAQDHPQALIFNRSR